MWKDEVSKGRRRKIERTQPKWMAIINSPGVAVVVTQHFYVVGTITMGDFDWQCCQSDWLTCFLLALPRFVPRAVPRSSFSWSWHNCCCFLFLGRRKVVVVVKIRCEFIEKRKEKKNKVRQHTHTSLKINHQQGDQEKEDRSCDRIVLEGPNSSTGRF